MTTLKLIFLLSLISLYSCAQNTPKYKVDPAAQELDNRAMSMFYFFGNPDSIGKAISLLDSAIAIDSNYLRAHQDKLTLLLMLKQFDKALLTVNKMISLRPTALDFYLTRGYLHYRLGDENSSKADYQKSLTICTNVLDTMSVTNRNYDYLSLDKAISLIMLGEQDKGNQIIKELYDKQTDSTFKEYYGSYLNKNAKEIFKMLDSPSAEKTSNPIIKN